MALKRSPGVALVATASVLLVLLVPVIVAGCGGDNSPEGAVRRFLSAWQDGDWEAYKASVAPERRKLTEVQEDLALQKFKQVKIKIEGLRLKTSYDDRDKNRARVTLAGGRISITARILGEKKTETEDLARDKQVLEVIRVKDTWYVDTPLG